MNETHDEIPDWALDPVSREIMSCPVTISAPCRHVMDKSTFINWTRQDYTVCPACYLPLTQMVAHKNKEMARKIHLLQNKNDPDDGDISFHPEMNLSSSIVLPPNSTTAIHKTLSLDSRIRFSKSENLSSQTTKFLQQTAARSSWDTPKGMDSFCNHEENITPRENQLHDCRHSTRTTKVSNRTTRSRSSSPLRRPVSAPTAPTTINTTGRRGRNRSASPTRIRITTRSKSPSPRVIKTCSPRTLQRLASPPSSPHSTGTSSSPTAALLGKLKGKVLAPKVPILKTTRSKDLVQGNTVCI
ncbi:expressed unknown protein [Seminavis robusta]|uniref:U-box domain-containing protein n=1 Tax=Seminavis robusta TaxID=568900 RepID=A0A9N8DYD8_9STRA|nr:expressed unknown protein [Seminavis robusta]|eukprot:Sro473_g150090.1 n/a (300) ;mRNA; r:28544-29443